MPTIARLNRLFCPLCGQRIHVWHTSQFDQTDSDALVVTTRWVGGVAHLEVAHEHAGEPASLGEQMSHYCSGVDQPVALDEPALARDDPHRKPHAAAPSAVKRQPTTAASKSLCSAPNSRSP